jgi:hypothetical protein
MAILISNTLRDIYGNHTYVYTMTTGTAGGGVVSEAHGIPLTTEEGYDICAVVHGADGALIENDNPAGHTNSDFTFAFTATNLEVDVPAAQTNVASRTLTAYIKTRIP